MKEESKMLSSDELTDMRESVFLLSERMVRLSRVLVEHQEAQEQENECLREALRFYASRTVRSSAGEDLGKRAREALGE